MSHSSIEAVREWALARFTHVFFALTQTSIEKRTGRYVANGILWKNPIETVKCDEFIDKVVAQMLKYEHDAG